MKRILSLLAVCLGACSSSNSSNVALSARTGSSASTAAASADQQTQALQACNGFVITRVRMVISEVKLEGDSTASDAGSSDEVEFKSSPILMDLPQSALDSGATQQVTVAEVPAGTYNEIRMKIHKVSQSEAGSDSGLQAMAAANASVMVDYTANGAARPTFVSSVDAQQKLEGTFALTGGSHALTLNIDASTWFTKGTSCLDPANSNNSSDIDDNIEKSLKAYEDDDHDGHEDHH